MFYNFLKFFIFPFIRIIWIQKVININNIPKKGGVIIASNHSSYFDFITLYSICPRRVYFLAGEVFFQKKRWSWLMRLTKQIKVDRNVKNKSDSLNTASKFLKENKVIGIFPEGTRSHDGKLQVAYNGAVKLSIMSGAPILPVGIVGTYEIMSRFDKFPKFKKCSINFGQLKNYSNDLRNLDDVSYLNSLTRELMEDIASLSGQSYTF